MLFPNWDIDAAAGNPNVINTILPNYIKTNFKNDIQSLNNGPQSKPRNNNGFTFLTIVFLMTIS